MSLNSSNVTVFPCVSRSIKGDDNTEIVNKAKLLSEENITNILKSVTDKKSYIINWEKDTLEMVIKGYYFKIEDQEKSGNKYAHIKFIENTGNYILIQGDNDESKFTGVEIIEGTAPDNDENCLTLCVNGSIPDDSKIKFTQKSISLKNIDCGELN